MAKYKIVLTFIIAAIWGSFAATAQLPAAWYREYPAGVVGVREVRPTADGGAIIVTSRLAPFEVFGQQGFLPLPVLIKTGKDGAQQWSRYFDGIYGLKSGLSVMQTKDGGYVIGGTQYTLDQNNQQDVFLFKTDALGMPVYGVFTESYAGFEGAASLSETLDGNYIFLKVTDLLAASRPSRLVKVRAFTGNILDPGGAKIWQKAFDHAYSAVRPLADGGYLLTGDTIPNPADSIRRLVITKVNDKGDMLWSRRYDQFRAGAGFMEVLPDQGAFMCFQYGFARSDAAGNILWADTSLPFTPLPNLDIKKNTDVFSSNPRMTLATDVAVKPDGRCIGTGVIREGPWTHIFLRQYAPGDGKVEWTRIMKPFQWNSDTTLPSVAVLKDGGIVVCGHRGKGGTFMLRTDANGLNGNVSGRVVVAADNNCQGVEGPPPFSWIIRATDASNHDFFATTDSTGYYGMWLPEGQYQLSAIPPNLTWKTCEAAKTIEIDFDDANKQSGIANFKVATTADCALLNVDMATNGWRKGYNSPLAVTYCNYGNQTAENAFVRIKLDTALHLIHSPRPFTPEGNGRYRIHLGNIAPGFCDHFNLTVRTSPDAIAGQTFCAEAHIYPDSLCTPFNDWLLALTDTCTSDSVKFTIRNVTGTDMDMVSNYIIVEDNILRDAGSLKLNSMQEKTFSLPANGSTYAISVQQNPDLPPVYGDSVLTAVVEGCGTTSNFSIGYYNQFSLRDGSFFSDKECQAVRSSFDPNDKIAAPQGFGNQHLIEQNTDLEYLIRFQNTGNDTAFTVMITDTLSEYLDPTSLQPGAASHPYDYQLIRGTWEGGHKIRFLFNNIALPDSTTNEPASHGFVKYRIRPKRGLPGGTLVTNRAAIFFDFNEAVMTNTTTHKIVTDGMPLVRIRALTDDQWTVYCTPNPVTERVVFHCENARDRYLNLQIFDVTGRLIAAKVLTNGQTVIERNELTSGILFFVVTAPNGRWSGRGKIVVE